MAAFPTSYRRVELIELSRNFREATKVISCQVADLLAVLDASPEDSVLIKNAWVGTNASDIIFSLGFT